MMTPFGSYEPLVLPSAADAGIQGFDDRVDAMGSSFARGRLRLLNDTTFAELGAARAAGIGLSTVRVRGRIECSVPAPKGAEMPTVESKAIPRPFE